ncbi:MAG: hypothetical protein ACI4D7_05465 [Lachnospiraceae bacterium]
MRKKLEKRIPPGADPVQELCSCMVLLLLEFVISLGYLSAYYNHLDNLYYIKGRKKYLLEGAVMPSLNELMQGRMFGFVILICGCMVLAAVHYVSFYRESKSIYLMKRLKSASELHKRCLALPVLCILCGIILMVILIALYSFIYYNLTPAQCLPEPIPFDLWRCIL